MAQRIKLVKWLMLAVTLALARDPRVMGSLPVGRLKKRLLAACRKRLVCGFESLLCPFFHRLSFDPVPERSFPDLTIFGVENSRVLAQLSLVPPDDPVAHQMTSRVCSRVRPGLDVILPIDGAIQH